MDKGYIPTSERNFTAPRLTELSKMGVVEPIGKKMCQYTGKTVAVYACRDGQMGMFDFYEEEVSMDEKTQEMIEEINQIIEEVQKGGQFALTKGAMGMDLSEDMTKLICNLLEDYLNREI